MTEINVWLNRTMQAGRIEQSASYVVTGEPDEQFLAAMSRVTGQPISGGDVELRVDGLPQWALIPIDRRATLEQVKSFVGAGTLPMAIVGRGGGVVFTLWDYLNAGLTLAGALDLLRRGHDAIDAVLWRHQRAAARRWIVAGTDSPPTMDLVQYFRAEPSWSLDNAAKAFAVDLEQAAKLLRALNYAPIDPNGVIWKE